MLKCFHPICYKSFDPKFKFLVLGKLIFTLSVWLPLGPRRNLGCTAEPDLSFNSPHKVQAYSLVKWYTKFVQAINIIADKNIMGIP